VPVNEKFICPSCGLAGEPRPPLDVCASCQALAVEQVHLALAIEGLPGGPCGPINTGRFAEVRVARQLEPAGGPQALHGLDQVTGLSGRVVMMLAERVAGLELHVEDFRDQLGEAGYLDLVDNDSDALYVALVDAEETRRARDVVAAHEHLFDDEDHIALALEQATTVMAEHEWARGQLYEHGWTDGDRSLPEAIDDVLAFAAEAERAYGLLFELDLRGDEPARGGAGLIAETVQVRAELGEAGFSCWAQPPAEVVRAHRRRRGGRRARAAVPARARTQPADGGHRRPRPGGRPRRRP
jgi:hypothetical protein